ncbi:hypothetical protein CIG19_09725 [Enterobacterales bacterium CwR94]|nr:hypothetical protein CIG19_09725 [Enterobacterales bacterium CwR94]
MTNNRFSPAEPARRNAFIWLVCCLAMVATLLALLPSARMNASVLALLPQQTLGAIPPALNDGFMQRLDRQVVWMVSPGKQADPQVAAQWLQAIRNVPGIERVSGPMSEQQQQRWGAFYFNHRNGNLDAATRARLATGGEAQAQWILGQIWSAFSGVSGAELKNDPLMLVRGAQMAQASNASQLSLMQGWLVAKDAQGQYWYFLHGELRGSSFDMQQTHRLVSALNAAQQQLQQQYPQADVLSRGTVFYSDYASQQAKQDVSTLGVATVIGVLLLIVLTFRSLRPLLLSLLSIGIGALAGCVSVLLVWGELHLMTLVMSISIVGISADYTLYYLTERMVHGEHVSRWDSLRKVRNALVLALLTTVAAYLIMMLAPFPGIRQMAVFAAAGLSASCLTVLFWHPWLCRHLPVRPVPAMTLMLRWLAAWRRNSTLRIGLPAALALLAAVGLSHLRVDDDISQLQALPASLLAQEKTITTLTGQGLDQKWFVVYGDTPEETLQRLEAFSPALSQARQQGWLKSWRSLPLNSLARQQADLALIQAAVPALQKTFRDAGLNAPQVDTQPMTITASAWLNSPASEGWRLLWLSLPDQRSGVLIPVEGVANSAALSTLAEQHNGVAWVDRKIQFDHLFSLYRNVLTALLLIALAVIASGAMLRLGWRKGAVSLVPSVLSLACGLAVLAATGHAVNLFSLLALVLVLGIGVNYTLFFSNPRGTPLTSLLAITLAMITTLLTLGMLIFSSTQAISSFGIVLCSGIFTAWLLSPLAMPNKSKRKPQ